MEPVTSLTDVVLSLLSGSIAWSLWRNAPRPIARRDTFWVGSFLALTIATALGAIIHGFPLGAWHWPVWAAIRGWTAVSEISFVLGTLYTVFGDAAARRMTAPVLSVFSFLLVTLVFTNDYFMLFETVGIGGATLLAAFHYAVMGQARSLALPLASVFFAVGAGLQAGQARFHLVWTFGGDDIFHLALMGALLCIGIAAHPSIEPLDREQPLRTPRLGIAGHGAANLPWRALQSLADRLPEGARNLPRGPFNRN